MKNYFDKPYVFCKKKKKKSKFVWTGVAGKRSIVDGNFECVYICNAREHFKKAWSIISSSIPHYSQ